MSAEQKIVSKIGFIYDEIYLLHKPIDWHPERSERLISILTALEERVDLKDNINFLNPDKANEEDLLSVHSESHVKNIMTKKVVISIPIHTFRNILWKRLYLQQVRSKELWTKLKKEN